MPAISWQEFIFVVHYSILVEEGRWDKDAFCGQDRNKTKCELWSPRCLKRSLYIAGLSSRQWYCVAQSCDNIIHLYNRYGAQPFPRRKRTSWNVSLSPMGFFQNFNCMSMGHHFKGKNAFSLMSLNIHCHLRFETCTITQREIYILIYPFRTP